MGRRMFDERVTSLFVRRALRQTLDFPADWSSPPRSPRRAPRALEDEQFDITPGADAYVGELPALRTRRYLGLDGQLCVDKYNLALRRRRRKESTFTP